MMAKRLQRRLHAKAADLYDDLLAIVEVTIVIKRLCVLMLDARSLYTRPKLVEARAHHMAERKRKRLSRRHHGTEDAHNAGSGTFSSSSCSWSENPNK